MSTIKFLLFGLALFFSMRVLGSLLNVFSRKYSILKRVNYVFPAIELSIWLAFVFWAIHVLFEDQFFYPVLMISMMLVVIISLSWFLVKDFIAGIIFKTQNEFQTGQKIKLRDTAGIIIALGPTYLKLETKKGEIMKIPYSQLSNEPIVKQGDIASTDNFRMTITLPKNENKTALLGKLRNTLLNLPWVSVTKKTSINSIEENNESFTFEIRYHSLNPNHAYLTEKALKSKFEIQ